MQPLLHLSQLLFKLPQTAIILIIFLIQAFCPSGVEVNAVQAVKAHKPWWDGKLVALIMFPRTHLKGGRLLADHILFPRTFTRFISAVLLIPVFLNVATAGEILTMATTTSTENSGLLGYLLPVFENEAGIRVKVIAKGTGAALRDGRDGNVDIIFVHARVREEQFVADGYGAYRLGIMHNDFVIVGPESDPAEVRGIKDAALALGKIAGAGASFVSRGDESGTHIKEQALWKASGVDLAATESTVFKKGRKRKISALWPKGAEGWYFSIGQGMGKTLAFAEEKRAYTLTDRGTFLKYKYGRDQGLDLGILVEGDEVLNNPYGVIPLNPEKFKHVNFTAADRLARWLAGPEAQDMIAAYKIEGRQAFFPDAASTR